MILMCAVHTKASQVPTNMHKYWLQTKKKKKKSVCVCGGGGGGGGGGEYAYVK